MQTFISVLCVGKQYPFKVDAKEKRFTRGKLIDFHALSQRCQFLWNGQIYDIPISLVKLRYKLTPTSKLKKEVLP